MSVPNRLNNSTATTKFVVDADELNENFDSLADGTGISDDAIVPRHITNQITDFVFPSTIVLQPTNTTPGGLQAGMMWFDSGISQFLGFDGATTVIIG